MKDAGDSALNSNLAWRADSARPLLWPPSLNHDATVPGKVPVDIHIGSERAQWAVSKPQKQLLPKKTFPGEVLSGRLWTGTLRRKNQ